MPQELNQEEFNRWSRDEGWSAESNYDYETAGRLTDFGYEVEFKIPFSSISFPNSKNQKWKIRLNYTIYRKK